MMLKMIKTKTRPARAAAGAFILISLLNILLIAPISAASAADGNVNINTARFEELTALPGVDEVLAAKIIKYRKDNNGFKTKFDILKIPEMNGQIFEKIQNRIVVSGQPAPGPAPAPAAPATPVPPAPAAPETGGIPTTAPAPSSRISEPPEDETGQAPAVPQTGAAEESPAGAPAADQAAPAAAAKNADEEEPAGGMAGISGEGRTASPRKTSTAVPAAPRSTRGRIDEARRFDITPDNYYKVVISLMRLGKYDKAESNIREFLDKFPGDGRADDMNYLLGACTEEKEKYHDAIEIYKKIYENPKSELKAISLFRIAICYDLQGNVREALENYRKYVSEFSDSTFVKDAEERINTILKVK